MVNTKSVTGRLNNNDVIIDNVGTTPIFADEWELFIEGADSDTDLIVSLVSTDNSFDPVVQALGWITGTIYDSDDNSGEGTNALITDSYLGTDNQSNTGRAVIRVTNSPANPSLGVESPYTLDISVVDDDNNIGDIRLVPKNTVFGDAITGSSVTINGQFNTEDFNITRNNRGYRVDEYRLEAPVGQELIITLSERLPSNPSLFLEVIEADTGKLLAENRNNGSDPSVSIAPGLGDSNSNGIPSELTIEDDVDYIIRAIGRSDSHRIVAGIDYRLEVSTPQGEVSVTPRITPTALELTGGTAQIAYVAYYGRPADNSGLTFWNNALTESNVSYAPRRGDSLTGQERVIYDDIVNQFGNSPEAERLFGGISSNRDKVNQVYRFAFNRNGDVAGLDFWTDQIDRGNVTLATFALEVALGAQNEDIITLYNKIESANLFSNSIDTQAEINAYSGSSGEIFGREWLDDYGDAISTQAQVDAALANLVDG